MIGRLKSVLLIAALTFTLTACGFAAAPVRHTVARTAQFVVKSAGAVIEHNLGTAEIVTEPAGSVASAAEALPPEQANSEAQGGARTHPSAPR